MPDLVRIETVYNEDQEDFEGCVGLLIDTDIDWNGNGVYTVHLPSQDIDVLCTHITTLAVAHRVKEN